MFYVFSVLQISHQQEDTDLTYLFYVILTFEVI